jgi:hypothetical protein
MHTVYSAVAAFVKGAISHHGVLGAIVLVVHRDNHRIIVFNCTGQLEGCQVIDVEYDLSLWDYLLEASRDLHVVDVILTIGRIEHFRGVVRILLLSDTHVYTDVRVAHCIEFKGDVQLCSLYDFLNGRSPVNRT